MKKDVGSREKVWVFVRVSDASVFVVIVLARRPLSHF